MTAFEQWLWRMAADSLEIRTGLFCILDTRKPGSVETVSSLSVPISPFNGKESQHLKRVIDEARKVGTAHQHSIGKMALSNILVNHGAQGGVCATSIFIPIEVDHMKFCLLAIPKNNQVKVKNFDGYAGVTKILADYFSEKISRDYSENRLNGVETYTKEIGHELANATQALLAKLRAITNESLSEKLIRRKALEAVDEVKALYGLADGLGIAIERNYVARSLVNIKLSALISTIASNLKQQAIDEKVILKLPDSMDVEVTGDKSALRIALLQIVGNAIKYSFDHRTVDITMRREPDQVVILVSNYGLELPEDDLGDMIYDFGVRSEEAKKKNVYGSGIGLYTCRKIAIAHGGRLWYETSREKTVFCLGLPYATSQPVNTQKRKKRRSPKHRSPKDNV